MSTAVIITGQARTFARCFKSQREAVFRRLDDPHFFVSFSRFTAGDGTVDGDPGAALKELEARFPGKVSVEWVDQPAFPEADRARFEEASLHAPWYRSVPVEGVWKQFWHLARGWEFAAPQINALNKAARGPGFVRFVRIRPDLHFHNWTPPRGPLRDVVEGSIATRAPLQGVHAPWWGSWGGCPDRFAYIVGLDATQQYFNVFHRINELLAEGCGYHPETLLARALERAGVPVHQTMDAEFTTIRTKGDKRPHDVPSYGSRDLFNFVNVRLAEEGRG